jgi:hypothetical protein
MNLLEKQKRRRRLRYFWGGVFLALSIWCYPSTRECSWVGGCEDLDAVVGVLFFCLNLGLSAVHFRSTPDDWS